jgi:hypothetical protein
MRHSERARQSAGAEAGQSLAISALAFFAADTTRLERFLNVTGLGPHNLREAARDPAFLGSVLDYLATDEPLLLAFAAEAGIEPDRIVRARQALAGADLPDDP